VGAIFHACRPSQIHLGACPIRCRYIECRARMSGFPLGLHNFVCFTAYSAVKQTQNSHSNGGNAIVRDEPPLSVLNGIHAGFDPPFWMTDKRGLGEAGHGALASERSTCMPCEDAIGHPFQSASSGCSSRLGSETYGTHKEAGGGPTGRVVVSLRHMPFNLCPLVQRRCPRSPFVGVGARARVQLSLSGSGSSF
jgi:hypothetical protein